MTSEIQLALIIAIPPTLAAIASLVATLLVDTRANKKLNHITILTNSTLTAANKRIDDLEKIIKDFQNETKKISS